MAKERNLQLGIVADASGLKKGLDDSKADVNQQFISMLSNPMLYK